MIHEETMKREHRFLFWRVVEWRAPRDGGVDCYSFGRLTDCGRIHLWMLRGRKWIL